jgi:ATP-binding cassette subfamily B protein
MPRVPLGFQAAVNDCGPACLQMIAGHFGRQVALEEIVALCPPARRGTSLAQLADTAERLGLRGLVARIAFENLRRVNLPCVAHLHGAHFVVVEKVTARRVRIADPARGRHSMTGEEFVEAWGVGEGGAGAVLLLEPSHDFAPTRHGGLADVQFFWRYLKTNNAQMAQVIVSIGIGSAMQLLIAFLTRSLVDVGIAARSLHFVYLILAAQLAMFAARVLNDFLRGWILLHVGARTNLSILSDFLKKLLRVSSAYIERKPVGDLLQRIGDHGRVQSFLTSSSISAISAVGNLVVFGLALAFFSLRVTAIFVIATAVLGTWMFTFAGKRRQLDQRRFRQSSETQTTLVQMIAGMRDVRLGTCEREKRQEWERLQAKQFQLSLAGLALTQHMQGGAMAINELRNILISAIAATEVIHGQMSLGTMLAISYMIGNLNAPVDQLIGLFQSGQDAKISVERIAEVHAAAEDAPPPPVRVAELPENLTLSIDAVTFRYPASAGDVLKSVTLDVPHGSRLAIVGPSGSGKTTMVKLLVRLYDPVEGEILVGGVPLRNIDATEWRRRCGVVMQDGYIFSDTLARNIALGAELFDFDLLRDVCRLARLDKLVRDLPEGITTRIGANGHELSAGERQRVLIARALYKRPDVFIFDEATSALDGANERELLHNLDRALAGKTVITVAHRLSTVVGADRIVVLQDGRLAEHGTHAELVSSKSVYFDLIRNQLELGS